MDEAPTALAAYKSSYRHLAWCFRRSRDRWKAKHQQLQRQHKRLQNQLRAVTASRARHRQAAEAAAGLAEQLRQQVEQLNEQVGQLQQRLAEATAAGEKRG